jgi:hypothetical protein
MNGTAIFLIANQLSRPGTVLLKSIIRTFRRRMWLQPSRKPSLEFEGSAKV